MAVACAPGRPAGSPARVTVFAAASLADAFRQLAGAFAPAHPDTPVSFNFAGSQQLAGQLTQSAPADVFAPADQRHMQQIAEAGLVAGRPRPFAGNRLAIAVEPGNPLGVRGLADLADPRVTVVLAADEVPAGAYARRALAAAGVQVTPSSLEADVRAVLGRVALGEADAGIVYVSDVVAARGRVEAVAIPPEHNVAVSYPIAVLAQAPNPDGARAFVDFVLSPAGQAVLARFGFAPPLDGRLSRG